MRGMTRGKTRGPGRPRGVGKKSRRLRYTQPRLNDGLTHIPQSTLPTRLPVYRLCTPNRTWNQGREPKAQRVSCGPGSWPVAKHALELRRCGSAGAARVRPRGGLCGVKCARDCHCALTDRPFLRDRRIVAIAIRTSVRCPCRIRNTTARRTPDPQSAMKSNRPAAPLRGSGPQRIQPSTIGDRARYPERPATPTAPTRDLTYVP